LLRAIRVLGFPDWFNLGKEKPRTQQRRGVFDVL